MLPRRAPHHVRSERGFSLVEVIIAFTILSIVMSAAAVAVVSSDSAEVRAKSVADSHAMAERAVERLRQDLSARATCDNGGWKTTARNVKVNSTASEANFAPCLVNYAGADAMRDTKGRRYNISLVVEPKDRASDGLGINDNDGDLRDAYEVETVVDLATDSKAGREDSQPIRVGGTVDWETGSTDDATIRVIACAIDRPDRALIGGDCSASTTTSRQPVNIQMTVLKVNESTGGTSTYGTITSGGAPGPVPPGAYRFSVPPTIGSSFKLLKLDPQNLRVYGSQNYTVYATYVRNDLRTRVCTQIAYWDTQPNDDGYEIRATNFHWRRTKQAGFRSIQLRLNGDGNPARGFQSGGGNNRTWNCSHILLDPVEASPSCPANPSGPTAACPSLYRGLYDIEVEQVEHFSNPIYVRSGLWPRYKLQVTGASMNCSLANWNQPMGGTSLIGRGKDGQFERPDSPQKNKASWYARMPINATGGTQTLCLRFHSKPFERVDCQPTYPYTIPQTGTRSDGTTYTYYVTDYSRPVYPPPCFYSGTICTLDLPAGTQDNDNNCWNGADVCMSCGSGGIQGTAGPVHAQRQSGGVSGGPNDQTVACNTGTVYNWPGSWMPGQGMSALVGKGTRDSYNWIGGDTFYRNNFSGRTSARAGHSFGVHPDRFTYNLPDNPQYVCEMSYFTAGSQLFAGNGGPYRYYECLEVSVPGRPYKVRGRLLDVSGSGTTFFGTVGTALALAPDSSIMQTYWNPFNVGGGSYPAVTGGGNWPDYNVARVTGDPNCGSPTIHIDPVIKEVWEKVVDEPGTRPLPPPPFTTNLGNDRVGI